nr:hypothetical protein [Elizabethkingia bruuniana]
MDQIGNIVWPDRKMILPDQFIDKNWKFGKIKSYRGMNDAYLISIEDGKNKEPWDYGTVGQNLGR